MGPKLLVGARTAYLRRRNLAYSFSRSSGKAITNIKALHLTRNSSANLCADSVTSALIKFIGSPNGVQVISNDIQENVRRRI